MDDYFEMAEKLRRNGLDEQAEILERYAQGDPFIEECGCVVDGQTCPLCRAVAAAVYVEGE